MRRGATQISALLAIDKPQGMSSHDVVNRVRHITGEGRVGHAGTLDPAATGVLIVGVGPATRLLPYLTGHDKGYSARIVFGTATNTDDAEGEVIDVREIPDELFDPIFAEDFTAGLVGSHEQVPPAFSAIKRGGVKAYAAARRGDKLELEARTIEVKRAELACVNVDFTEGDALSWDIDLVVSKGTYVRALARDMGSSLRTCAHLGDLRRTASGNVTSEDAVSLEDLEGRSLETLCLDPVRALGFPRVSIDASDILPLCQGNPLAAPQGTPEGIVCLTHAGRLLSVHACKGGTLVPKTVIPGGVMGASD